jgi:membrane associated rhomboid family serine protease
LLPGLSSYGAPGRRDFAFTLEVVSAGGPDLFVVCKNCGSEVSPYITECPYCGTRLRKRAPKLDRNGRISERTRRPLTPSLSRLRRGEIPGIRHESHPYATSVLVLLGVAGTLIWRTTINGLNLVILGHPGHQWWRVFTAPFIYNNSGYAVLTLLVIAIYGWLMERRHGPVVVIFLVLVGGAGGLGLAGLASSTGMYMGANGAALALLCAWVVPDLALLARKQDYDGDLLGTAVFAAVIALMPLAEPAASWVATGVGLVAGLSMGQLLRLIHH